jgi:hypothetical protein
VKVLGEISSLVSSLREKAGELGDAAEVLPLLVSTKTLLETARERTKKSS